MSKEVEFLLKHAEYTAARMRWVQVLCHHDIGVRLQARDIDLECERLAKEMKALAPTPRKDIAIINAMAEVGR